MNAEAYLRKQGWQGAGHSLDGEGRGIAKPLLIAHKQDQLGLGKKKAAYTTDDQWWMRAFDESLKNIGTGQDSTLDQIRTKGINRGGLYGFFVKGEGIAGTLSGDEATSGVTSADDTDAKTKRKRGAGEPAAKSKKSRKEKKDKSKKADGDSDGVAKKLAKLSVEEKASYAERAAAKGQSLEEYVKRRIEKKAEQRAAR